MGQRPSRTDELVAAILAANVRLSRELHELTALATELRDHLEAQPETPVEHPVEPAFKAPLQGAVQRAWRDARRSGHPARIDCDPELQAFILATLPGRTYAQTVEAIAAAFPPDRRVSLSTLHRWSQLRRQAEAGQSNRQ